MSTMKLNSFPVTGMDCANCATAVERNIEKVPGVNRANVNLSTERASVEYDPDLAKKVFDRTWLPEKTSRMLIRQKLN